MTTAPSLNAYIIIATKGRAAITFELLTWLQRQTLPATLVVAVGTVPPFTWAKVRLVVPTVIVALVVAGHIKPIVGASYPLEEAAEALKLLDNRGATGKVVLEIPR